MAKIQDINSRLFKAHKSWLKSVDSALILVGFAAPGDATPAATLNHVYLVEGAGTVFGIAAVDGNFLKGDGAGWRVLDVESYGDLGTKVDKSELNSLLPYDYTKGIKSFEGETARKIYSAIIKVDIFVVDPSHEYGIEMFGWYNGTFFINVFDLTTNTQIMAYTKSFASLPTGIQVFENNTSSVNWMFKLTMDCDLLPVMRWNGADPTELKIVPQDIASDDAILFIDYSKKLLLDTHRDSQIAKGLSSFNLPTNTFAEDYARRSIKSIDLFTSNPGHEYQIIQFGYMSSIQAFLFGITDVTLSETLDAKYFVFATAPTGIQTFELSGEGYFIRCVVDCDKYYSLYGNTDSAITVATIGVLVKDINSDAGKVYFNELTQKIDRIAKVTDEVALNIQSETWTDFLYANYIGYNKVSAKDCYLKSLEFVAYNTAVTIDTPIEFSLLAIDQRNWLLPRLTFFAKPVSISPTIKFDFSDLRIKKYAGETLMVKCIPAGNALVFSLSDDTYDSGNKLVYGELTGVANYHASKGAMGWKEITRTIDSSFAELAEFTSVKENTSLLNASVAKMNVLKDSVTGANFRIKVINGVLSITSMAYTDALFIGHSYFNASANGGLGVSVTENDIPHLMLSTMNEQHAISTTPNLLGGVDFERGYDAYDLTLWNSSLVSTLKSIVICLGANATYSTTMQNRWEAMLNHVKSRCPNADIYCSDAWCGGDVHNAIKNACLSTGVTYVDMNGSGYLPSTKFSLGDYTYNAVDGYQPITNAGIAAHPNDFGAVMITDSYLDAMSYDKILTRSISINITGNGVVTTSSLIRPKNGIVSFKITGAITTITAVDSVGGAVVLTERSNEFGNYYTFTMPDSNVIVTAVF